MSQPGDDAQRDMEQKALRNVRGLLDKIEDQDRLDRKATVRIAVICGVAAAVLVALLVAWLNERKAEPGSTKAVVIPAPAKNVK